jgi:hypothetical protein
VTKKDPSHPGAVVVKYDDDGTLAWWPVEHILGWIQVSGSPSCLCACACSRCASSRGAASLVHVLGPSPVCSAQEAEAAGVSDTIGSAAQIFAAEVLTDLASSGRRGTERSHADNSGSPPQSTARVHSGADSASSSQMSETSMAALGRSMGEEACGGVLSSLKGSRPAAGGREGSWRHRW